MIIDVTYICKYEHTWVNAHAKILQLVQAINFHSMHTSYCMLNISPIKYVC